MSEPKRKNCNNRMVIVRATTPRTCAFCKQFRSEDGSWECMKGRTDGDVGEGFQHERTCNGWRNAFSSDNEKDG